MLDELTLSQKLKVMREYHRMMVKGEIDPRGYSAATVAHLLSQCEAEAEALERPAHPANADTANVVLLPVVRHVRAGQGGVL